MIRHSILVVDDEPAQRQFLRAVLEKDYQVTAAADGREARQLLQNRGFDLVITDQRMPGLSGTELLRWIRENLPELPVVMLTAFGSIDSAVEAMRLGAADYLTKPVESPEQLRLVVARCFERKGLQAQHALKRVEQETEYPAGVVAESAAMRGVLILAEQVAPLQTTVLITGESGVGKEVVARHIHRCSPRSEGPFVAVNCAALTETLLESELFGHEKGAFTGAVQSRPGRFELAHGGTLFLDEIGETSPGLQTRLLRVLQEQQFERVGGVRTLTVDVRIIAATNRDLRQAIVERTFREDLFYRLNVFPIPVPPLRERRDDIPALARFFLRRLAARMGRQELALSPAAEAAITAHDWPGNVRELQNAIERALIVAPGPELRPEDLPLPSGTSAGIALPAAASLADLEKQAILSTLERVGGDRRQAAEALGISLRTLQYRLKEYGLAGR